MKFHVTLRQTGRQWCSGWGLKRGETKGVRTPLATLDEIGGRLGLSRRQLISFMGHHPVGKPEPVLPRRNGVSAYYRETEVLAWWATVK